MNKKLDVQAMPAEPAAEGPLDPLDWIRRDHERQLEICHQLENVVNSSDGDRVADWAATVLAHLTEELPLHFADEESDLFPLLLSKPGRSEELAAILEQLVSEHDLDSGLIDPVIEQLRLIADGKALQKRARFQACVYTLTAELRRHLNWEDRIVLPLADKLLTREDRVELRRRIADRRRRSSTGS